MSANFRDTVFFVLFFFFKVLKNVDPNIRGHHQQNPLLKLEKRLDAKSNFLT